MADETGPDDSEPTLERQAQADTPGDRWGVPITPARAADLKKLADHQHAWAAASDHQGQESYFKDVRLMGADVFWLAAYALAGPDGDLAAAQERLRTARDGDGYIARTALHLEGADLRGAYLERADLRGASLEQANLREAHLEGTSPREASLEGATLTGAHLERANLFEAHLEGADLSAAYLERADLRGASLERADLRRAWLEGADLRGAWLDHKTVLANALLDTRTRLGDIQWSGVGAVNLTQLEWNRVPRLDDETTSKGTASADDYEAAVRAYRQLAAQLRAQGMSEVADRFLYRAQVVQRRVLLKRGHWGRWFGTWLLDAISGHGYKPIRSVLTYVIVVLGFAAAYFSLTNFGITPFLPSHSSRLAWYEAVVLSISSFHGRGFFPKELGLGDPIAMFAAGEAIIGLLIEITFIATFTQRFFAR